MYVSLYGKGTYSLISYFAIKYAVRFLFSNFSLFMHKVQTKFCLKQIMNIELFSKNTSAAMSEKANRKWCLVPLEKNKHMQKNILAYL